MDLHTYSFFELNRLLDISQAGISNKRSTRTERLAALIIHQTILLEIFDRRAAHIEKLIAELENEHAANT